MNDLGICGVPFVTGECVSCGERAAPNECKRSKRPCGHHCNHVWSHDCCDWCGVLFGEGGAEGDGGVQ